MLSNIICVVVATLDFLETKLELLVVKRIAMEQIQMGHSHPRAFEVLYNPFVCCIVGKHKCDKYGHASASDMPEIIL